MQPDKVGRYEILRELGRGAMGRVLLAHDPQIDRKIAIKLIQSFSGLPESEQDDARERFLREARSAGRLLHPGIVTLFDAGETGDGALYLAMEYVEGATLDTFCKPDMLLEVGTAVRLVIAAAEALHYAHQSGIIHRDIKPANLMQQGEGGLKIMDFGLARGIEANLTQDGALLGTPSYMSPEQIRGQQLDGRSDLFSLGLVLFELLTGDKPFPGDSISSIIYRIVHEDARDASVVHDRVPEELDAFLSRAMAKDADDRFQDGASFAAELQRAAAPLLGAAPVAASATVAASARPVESSDNLIDRELPATERAAPRKSSAMPFVIGILVLIGAAAGGLWYFKDDLGLFQPPPQEVIFLETRVRTQPTDGVEVTLDGEPLDLATDDTIRFPAEGPFGLLSATSACRVTSHQIGPADAGQQIELVLDPIDLDYRLETEPAGARVHLNGESLGKVPLDLGLDLCRDNELVLEADGFQPTSATLAAGLSRIEARRTLADLSLAPVPKGTLSLPGSSIALSFRVDGKAVGKSTRSLELPAGRHRVRATNDRYWIDVSTQVEVVAGESVTARLPIPELTRLRVQAFPANCKVDLRRPGGRWRYLDDTPAETEVAVGAYQVRVTLKPTGESKIVDVTLGAGSNPDVRVAFGS